jgi:hypothetical protein
MHFFQALLRELSVTNITLYYLIISVHCEMLLSQWLPYWLNTLRWHRLFLLDSRFPRRVERLWKWWASLTPFYFLYGQLTAPLLHFILLKTPTNALYMLTLLYSHYTLLHVSALKTPFSGSTDTVREQGQQNACPDVNIWKANHVYL